MRSNSPRILALDLLRIIAILLILAAHISQFLNISLLKDFYGLKHLYYISIGGFGVSMLLITSGATIRLNYSNITNFKKFLIGRMVRIYPAYWCALIFAFSLNPISLDMHALILSILGLHAFFGEWGGPILNVSWFIGLIMILYSFYPFINYEMKKNSYFTLMALLVISIISRIYLGRIEGNGRIIDWFPLCRVFEFGLGIFIIEKDFYFKNVTKSKLVAELSELCFYIFLIHCQVLFLLNLSLMMYVSIVILLAGILYTIDKKIIRKFLFCI